MKERPILIMGRVHGKSESQRRAAIERLLDEGKRVFLWSREGSEVRLRRGHLTLIVFVRPSLPSITLEEL